MNKKEQKINDFEQTLFLSEKQGCEKSRNKIGIFGKKSAIFELVKII
jgi:hypothetical protein